MPFVVTIASFVGFAKAAFLGFMGLIGILSWDDVSDPRSSTARSIHDALEETLAARIPV